MSAKLRSVQALSTRTLEDSTDSYNRALNIYQQALAMQVPTVDSQELEDKARKVRLNLFSITLNQNKDNCWDLATLITKMPIKHLYHFISIG